MGEWVGTDSLELTKQGSFPLVFGVLPILHLLDFFCCWSDSDSEIYHPFFYFGRGMAGLEVGYWGWEQEK